MPGHPPRRGDEEGPGETPFPWPKPADRTGPPGRSPACSATKDPSSTPDRPKTLLHSRAKCQWRRHPRCLRVLLPAQHLPEPPHRVGEDGPRRHRTAGPHDQTRLLRRKPEEVPGAVRPDRELRPLRGRSGHHAGRPDRQTPDVRHGGRLVHLQPRHEPGPGLNGQHPPHEDPRPGPQPGNSGHRHPSSTPRPRRSFPAPCPGFSGDFPNG